MYTSKVQLTDRLVAELRELYFFENQLVGALKGMADAAQNEHLKQQFRTHQAETQVHVERLEAVFALLHTEPRPYPTQAVMGLMDDGRWIIHTLKGDQALDTALLSAAQKAELLEVACYRSAIVLADLIGMDKVVDLLESSLEDEIRADKMFRIRADHTGGIKDRTQIEHTRAQSSMLK